MGEWFSSIFTGQNMLYASSAMEGVSKIVQGNQGGKYLEYQEGQALADAQAELEIGKYRSKLVRKAAGVVRGEATAAQGASGSNVDSKSAEAVREFIDRGGETDALMELYGGQRKSASQRGTAAGYKAQAANTRQAGYGAATKSLLSGAGSAAEIQRANDKWLRRTQDFSTRYPNQFSLEDPAYG